ncbi:MAG: hypothetical protein HY390_02505, partial [Deltaproteobacteria bacterium]|nr:hypothetical protein [Deltaproteobacteria bacterium]
MKILYLLRGMGLIGVFFSASVGAVPNDAERLADLKEIHFILRSLEERGKFSISALDLDLPSIKAYRAVEEELQSLSMRYKNKHPKMKALAHQKKELKNKIFVEIENEIAFLNERVRIFETEKIQTPLEPPSPPT